MSHRDVLGPGGFQSFRIVCVHPYPWQDARHEVMRKATQEMLSAIGVAFDQADLRRHVGLRDELARPAGLGRSIRLLENSLIGAGGLGAGETIRGVICLFMGCTKLGTEPHSILPW